MITDGQVHDVPKSAQALGFDAPVHALLTGQPDEFDRRIEVLKAPRYGIVGSTREIEARVVETGRTRPRRRARHAQDPPRGPARRDAHARRSAAPCTIQMPFPHAGPEHRRDRAGDGAGRADARQQPRGGGGRGRAREPARAAGLGRAARRRARVAQPAEVRRRRRPRALHHSASAAEAGRHADPPALADRLPDARAVLGEDQGLRPHHLRPLPAPRHPAAALLREHRPLRGAGRRAAGRRRRRLRRPDEPVAHAAVGGAAGDAHRPRCSSSPSRPSCRPTASSIPSRAACPAARATAKEPDLGPLVPPGRRDRRAAAAPS